MKVLIIAIMEIIIVDIRSRYEKILPKFSSESMITTQNELMMYIFDYTNDFVTEELRKY